MYAKWIHPKKIIPHTSDVLRHKGKITVFPSERELILAGYYPVILKDNQSLDNPENIYYVKENAIYILQEEGE